MLSVSHKQDAAHVGSILFMVQLQIHVCFGVINSFIVGISPEAVEAIA